MSLKITLRNLTVADFTALKESWKESYRSSGTTFWTEKAIRRLLRDFPEGQLCIDYEGKTIAVALSLIVNYSEFSDDHTYRQITNNERLDSHNDYGDVLYGIEVFVHPNYRNLRLGHRLYEARRKLCKQNNLKSIMFGGRIPNYEPYASQMSVFDYVDKVNNKELKDTVLNFQLSNGFIPVKVLKNYLPEDRQSAGTAVLLKWENQDYESQDSNLFTIKSKIRLGIVQWQVRPINDIQEIFDQIEFFTDAVASYKSDFLLFPEFFNTPLMAKYNHLNDAEAIRKLATYTPRFKEKMSELAISYNVNIITGTLPLVERGKLYNVSYLCRRDGRVASYRKIHITPSEKSAWGMVGGNSIPVFDTDAGRIAIQICYDIEFPELSRILAEQGVQIIFVPFQTDTKNGYLRVRNCSQARAIENECYVAIAGCVGNIPKVANMDINYASSAVFSPSDFAFPTDAIIAEATPNTESMIIADLDLTLLKDLHNNGSVKNLLDRRQDVYRIQWKEKF